MIVIENIRKYYRKNCLKSIRQASNRNISCSSLNDAKYIGILYEIGEEHTYITLNTYVTKLLAEGKTLRIIGFHNNKYVPHYCIPQLKYDFFCQKDLNWFGKPIAPLIQEFADEPFDMLIDLSMEVIFPLQYVLAKSTAKFKVGRQNDSSEDYYDLMINLDETHDVNDLIYYINEYTNKLNGK
jgi:hypothetical protein